MHVRRHDAIDEPGRLCRAQRARQRRHHEANGCGCESGGRHVGDRRLHVGGSEAREPDVSEARRQVDADRALVADGRIATHRRPVSVQPRGEIRPDRLTVVARHRPALPLHVPKRRGRLAPRVGVAVLPAPLPHHRGVLDDRHPSAVGPLVDRPLAVPAPPLLAHVRAIVGGPGARANDRLRARCHRQHPRPSRRVPPRRRPLCRRPALEGRDDLAAGRDDGPPLNSGWRYCRSAE